MTRRTFLRTQAGLLVAIGLSRTAAGQAGTTSPTLHRFEFAETHMGSEFRISLYTNDDTLARRASRAAFARIAGLDASYSDYNPESELSRLCDRAGGPPVRVSPDLFEILTLSKHFAEASHGAFDVTIAPVGRLWRRARREKKLPDPETLKRARALVGIDRLELDPIRRTARLATPGMRLDLGGIAKGHASQAAIDTLKREGVPIALVAGAGDIVAGDPPPGKEGWEVAIASEVTQGKLATPKVILRNKAISTSGDTERFVEIGGVRYSHILDPKTGIGLTRRIQVTVVAPRGAVADAVDTAASVLGIEAGRKMIDDTPGAAGYLLVKEGDAWAAHASTRWEDVPVARP